MIKTNFDKSGTGIDIQFSCFYDTYIASINFDESFTNISSGYRKVSKWFYTDYGNFEIPDVNDWKLYKIKKQDLINLMIDKGYNYKGLNMQEMVDELSYNDNDWLNEFEMKDYTWLATCGYSQGDYAEILVHNDLIKQCGEKAVQASIDRLFWDCPVYLNITINENEYSTDSFLFDEYEWDRDNVVENARELFNKVYPENAELIMEFLEGNLPEYPNYN